MTAPDLQAAADALAIGVSVIDRATAHAASLSDVDEHQSLLYDLAHSASAIQISRSLLDYGAKGESEGKGLRADCKRSSSSSRSRSKSSS